MKISKDQKIEILERIIKAIFSRQEGTIEYKSYCKNHIEVTVECDVDDAVKVLTSLSNAEIDYWFYTTERKLNAEDSKFWGKDVEGCTEIILTLEPRYWKEVDKLEKEIKELKKVKKNGKD